VKNGNPFRQEVDLKDYIWLESQAYAFAGLVLVPPSLPRGISG